MKILIKLSVILITILILGGCKKEWQNPGNEPYPNTKKIWKIKTNEKDSTLFAYTTTGDLFKVITTQEKDNGEKTTYTILYDPGSRVTEISSAGNTIKFIYQSNSLLFTENYAGVQKVSESHFEYVGTRLTAIILFAVTPSGNGEVSYKPTLKTAYEYDFSGQVKKVATYLITGSHNTLTKVGEKVFNQYDNKRNPLTIMTPFAYAAFYDLPGEHNVVKETVFDEAGDVEKTTINSYVYDSTGYPVTVTSVTTDASGTPTTNTIRYFYK